MLIVEAVRAIFQHVINVLRFMEKDSLILVAFQICLRLDTYISISFPSWILLHNRFLKASTPALTTEERWGLRLRMILSKSVRSHRFPLENKIILAGKKKLQFRSTRESKRHRKFWSKEPWEMQLVLKRNLVEKYLYEIRSIFLAQNFVHIILKE